MAFDEYARPPLGTEAATGPREVAVYMAPRGEPWKPPVVPSHIALLEAEAAQKG